MSRTEKIFTGGNYMAAFQIITEKNRPKFVVLPFGDEKAAQDYMDELWAEKAAAKFNKSKPGKLFTLAEVKQKLGQGKRRTVSQIKNVSGSISHKGTSD
jgi:hypothetical protein